MASTKHSAEGQALGYVHQVGWGLLELVRPGGPDDYELRLETVDDVSWHDAAGDPLRALQIKHHRGGGTLTDAGPDLWRTVGVWLDDPVLLDPAGPSLILTTTQNVAEDSALSLLGADNRGPQDARELLDRVAASSENRATHSARRGWLRLPEAVRSGVCERVTVLWEQGTAEQLASLLKAELRLALPHGREDRFVDLLLGWWWRVAVDLLRGARSGVTRVHVHLYLDDLREQFSARSLPLTVGYDMVPPTVDAERGRTFARQLDWIGASEQLLVFAVRDYYRAYAQMQDWVENHMVELAELQDYERRLVEEWTLQFEFMRQRLGPSATEDDMREVGMRLYQLVMEQSPALLRPGLTDPFYARGTHHRLADDESVGWHPQFRDRLERLLGGHVA